MRADYDFSTSEIAVIAAVAAIGELRDLRYLLTQTPVSWRWLEEGADVGNMLSVRIGLTGLAGAAYAMQDAPAFCAATETLLRYPLAASRSYTAAPAQLLLDVALGIALHQADAAHRAAAAILATGGHDDPALMTPAEVAARTLAHLAVGSVSMAGLSAQDMAGVCATKRYSKHSTTYFNAWADAAAALAQDDGEQLHEALSRVDQAHHARLEAGLVRAARGCPADWSSAVFWDWLTAPVVAMAFDRQMAPAQSRRYSDARWVAAAAMLN